MKSKLIVCGAAGRMGKRIIALALESGEFELIGAVEKAGHPDMGKDAGLLAGIGELDITISDQFSENADVVIDFSLPEAAVQTVDYCVNQNCALVMGTTGLDQTAKDRITEASKTIPVIYGTNMSVGMNVLFALAGKAAAMLGDDYDIEIIEQHHRFKKDAPSGSALTLAENICKSTGRKFPESVICGREGKDALRQKGTIGIHAVRAGDIVGIHDVQFSCLGETVTLSHKAHSRDGFAKGALQAAKWLIGKSPGTYNMANVMGIK